MFSPRTSMRVGKEEFGEMIDNELDLFSRSDFDAKRFTQAFYEQNTEAQAKAFCMQLLEHRGKATDHLQRMVFKHYPKFIESAEDLRKMDAGLSELRRGLGKTEFVLQSIQVAASNLERLRTFEEKRLEVAKRREKERRKLVKLSSAAAAAAATAAASASGAQRNFSDISGARTSLGGGNRVEQRLDAEALAASLEASRFKKVQSLYSDESFALSWLIEAPDKLQLLLHREAFEEAVDLVKRVRSVDLDAFQVQVEAKLQRGEHVDTYMLDEKLWALYYAIRVVEEEAEEFLDDLLQLLEKNQHRLGGRVLADYSESSLQYCRHPVELVSALGEPVVACRGYLRGRRRFIREISDEVIYGPLATEPEQCIIELAQGVFGAILETSIEFCALFSKNHAEGAGGKFPSKERATLATLDEKRARTVPDTLQSLFVVWAHEEVTRFCTNFVRFIIPGYQEQSREELEGATGSNEETSETMLGDDLNALAMKGIPFPSEKNPISSPISLSDAQWSSLGTCLRWTLVLCRRLEKEEVVLGFVVARQLGGPIRAVVDSLFASSEKALRTQLRRETWQAERLRVESRMANSGAGLALTSSGQAAYSVVGKILDRIKNVYKTSYATRTEALEGRIVDGIIGVLKTYLENLVHAAGAWSAKLDGSRDKFEEFVFAQARRGEGYRGICSKIDRPLSYREKRCVTILMSEPYSNAQILGMIADVLYVSTDLSVRAVENFEKLFKRRVQALRDFLSSVRSLDNEESPWRMLCDAFVTRNANRYLEDVVQWSQFNYSSIQRGDTGPAQISPNFERMATVLGDLKNLAEKILGGHSCALDMVASIVEHMIDKLEADGMAAAIFGPVDGEANAVRLAEDLNLLLKLPTTLMQREPSDEAVAKVKSILKSTGAAAILASGASS